MDAATIQKIIDLAPVQELTIHGLPYTDERLDLVEPPQAPAFAVSTLDGFVNLLEAGIDAKTVAPASCLIHVTGPAAVELVQRNATDYGKRPVHIQATILEGMTKFPYFNQWGEQEMFVIGLQSHFQQNADLDELIKLASHIDMKDSIKLTDDGRSQEVVVQKGVAFRENTETKKKVNLKPFRTFRELDQPASDFVFRVKAGGGMALYEADGGAWKIAAVNAIAAWLSNRIKTSEVPDLAALPIIS